MGRRATKKVDLRRADWVFLVNRNMSYLHNWLGNLGYAKFNQLYGLGGRLITLGIIKGFNTNLFRTKKESDLYVKEILKNAQNSAWLKSLKEKYGARGEALINSAEKLSVGDINNKKAAKKLLSDYFSNYEKYTPTLNITAVGGVVLTKELIANLATKLSKKHLVGEIISAVTLPDSLTPAETEEIELLKIAAGNKNQLLGALKLHYLKYQHLPANFVGEGWSHDDFKKRLEGFVRGNPKEMLATRLRVRRQALKNRDNLFREIGPNLKIRNLILAVRIFSDLNEYRKLIFTKVNFVTRHFFSSLARARGMGDWSSMHYLSPQEIMDVLANNNLDAIKNKLKLRKRLFYGCYFNGIESRDIPPVEIQSLVKKLLKHPARAVSQNAITGVSGNVGVARGMAVVVKTPKDFSKVKVGNILVASMTSTDYIMVMKKAAAFVTDEGGLTSHPAIVAREMGKPCIVGTRLATRFIKTGDLVEVDADNGIVRKLTKL